MQDFSVCLDILRIHDPDRFYCSLLTPKPLREAITVLYAFNAEISRIRDLVSEPMPGEIRLQWWRDVIAADGARARASPLANALLEILEKYNLPRDSFDKILLARAFDLYNDPVPDLVTLEGYCGETTSLVFQLSALICGASPSRPLADACGHAGVAYQITHRMRFIGRDAARGQVYLPVDLLVRAGGDEKKLLSGEMHDGLTVVMKQLTDKVRYHLEEANAVAPMLEAITKPVFYPLALIPLYLKRLEKPGFNPFVDDARLSQMRLQWALWRAR